MSLRIDSEATRGRSLAESIALGLGCVGSRIPQTKTPITEVASSQCSNPALLRAQNCPSFPPGMPTLAGEVENWHPKN